MPVILQRPRKQVKRAVDISKILENCVFESSAYQIAENLQWSFDSSTDSNDLLIQPTLEDYKRILVHEKWLDAQEYQFDNHEEACVNLGFVDQANPRMKGMQSRQELKFWQPVCINCVAEMILCSREFRSKHILAKENDVTPSPIG
ncbi:hypothetical protein BO79DRAFT_260036 [Aspergillus costaricaensis CBS 115574]|uniref:Uncharacterized protein n=1 Tax=Aspergillus costaricaensis CBS 115574 TaxID=1448317 RepID=A0ACD1I038_9EURO|nr:hypothetical protein BO79DRAFT_260036 [Aspergillus costaricaensis CBS 115574]RAK83594.1 hypothetical protein BO79DRAFT_260036 [Aspergillus costaricaensis CBS 115574]